MSESMQRADDADKQRAFLGLLACQLVTPSATVMRSRASGFLPGILLL